MATKTSSSRRSRDAATQARPKAKRRRSPRNLALRRAGIDAVGLPASKRVLRSQGRRTMRKLLDAAMVAFDQRGYHATRVNDVVEIAKTSHGTFYLYFSNKEDLLRALVAEAATEAQSLDASSQRGPESAAAQWDDVRRWVRSYSDLWVRYAPLFRAWTDLAKIDPELTESAPDLGRDVRCAGAPDRPLRLAITIIDAQAAGMAVLAMLDRFPLPAGIRGPTRRRRRARHAGHHGLSSSLRRIAKGRGNRGLQPAEAAHDGHPDVRPPRPA